MKFHQEPIGIDCDADPAAVIALDRARRVGLRAIDRALDGEEWDAEEIKGRRHPMDFEEWPSDSQMESFKRGAR